MNRILMIVAATVLTIALLAGVVSARNAELTVVAKPSLENVRDYAAAVADKTYAIDGGVLFAGGPQGWVAVATPDEIIAGAVAVDPRRPETIYVGAANTLTLYRSNDGGQNWLRVPLSDEYIGGVTDIAVDGDQRLVYVGTDTAGLFRLRDVGSSIILSGHLRLDEPVVEVAADSSGQGMVFARTRNELYRAESYGMNWSVVENLGSAPTALTIAGGSPATVYVGTTDRGLVKSTDGSTWVMANEGLGLVPGSRLQVDALAVDPQQPNVLYVATSYLYGTGEVHQSPVGVAMSTNGAENWVTLHTDRQVAVASLLPLGGETGAVYAVTNLSRTPQPLGTAPAAPAEVADSLVDAQTGPLSVTGVIAWIVAGLAALALVYSVVNDLRRRRPVAGRPLAKSPVHNNR
ncbi:MAG: hypothetical protein DCC55_13920 [Chloroflexi bacterium]|nr:MAG: hypothetical protein DCC55_13920 [Chloroflexota bacterium]